AAGPDRLDQGGDAARIVGAVAVHEHHDVGVLGRHGRRQARPAIAAPGLDDVRTRGFGPRRGGGATAPRGPHAAGYDRARDAAHHIRDRLLLIERRYHHDDATCCGFAHATMIAPERRVHRFTGSSAGRSLHRWRAACPTAALRGTTCRPRRSRSLAAFAAWRRPACSFRSRAARTARCSRAAPAHWRWNTTRARGRGPASRASPRPAAWGPSPARARR